MAQIQHTSFKIYHKKKGIYWTNTLIVYAIIVPCLLILLIKNDFSGVGDSVFDSMLILIILATFIYAITIGFIGLARYEPIKGYLRGFLVLNLNVIHVDYKIYNLNDIKKIEFSNSDYKGRMKYRSSGSIEPIISQGVENKIIISMNSGEVEKYYFQQLNENDLSKARKQLIYYHQKGKIHFLHLIDILNITDFDHIKKIKQEILES